MTSTFAATPRSAITLSSARRLDLPGLFMGAFLILLPVQISPELGATRIAPSDFFLFLYFVSTFRNKPFLRVRVWSYWHAALLFVFALATLTAILNTGETSSYIVLNKDCGLLLLCGAYAAVAAQARSLESMRRMLRLFILSVFVTNILALLSFYGYAPWLAGNMFAVQYSGRLAGTLVDPNAYGGLLAVTLAIHITTYHSPKPIIGGPLGMAITICLAYGVLLTYSRSAWISSVMIILGLVFVNRRAGVVLIGTIGLLIAVAVLTADRVALDNMILMASRPEQVESRVDIISKAIPMFLQSPILGTGLGVFYTTHMIIIHNTPVWFLTEFGLIGLFAFTGYVLWIWHRSYVAYTRVPSNDRALVHGLAMAHGAMIGLSLGVEALYQRHWWVATAMVVAASSQNFLKSQPASDICQRHV